MRCATICRTAGRISAVVVATITFGVTAQALQVIQAPNSFTFSYSLSPGADTGGHLLVSHFPVFVMADHNVPGDVGSGSVMMVSDVADDVLYWNGLESAGGGETGNFSNTPGQHIVYIDKNHQVSLVVNDATSFRVHNTAAFTAQGQVTLLW